MLLASCGKSDEASEENSGSTEQTATSSTDENVSTANVDEAKPAGPVIASSTLKGFLPASVGSYKVEGDPETMQAKMGDFEYSFAKQEYIDGKKRIRITVADYNMVESLTAAYTMMMNMSMESDKEVTKGEKFQGKAGVVTYQKDNSRAQIAVAASDRVWLILEGENGAGIDDLRAAANSMDLNAIAGAK